MADRTASQITFIPYDQGGFQSHRIYCWIKPYHKLFINPGSAGLTTAAGSQ